MSDLNLDNIVGFKAVDKDGNEQNVTVDEMVDMVSTRMVMALSETSTFAAVAATGNDVYENELPTVTDAANVRVLQSSGDAAQMTMQSLASKLGGLFTSLKLWRLPEADNGSSFGDANELISGGIYRNYPSDINMPSINSNNNGILIVLPVNNIMVLQVCYYNIGKLYIRLKWGTNWSSWMMVSLT
nr:MAG TPA: putative tail fiber protein [Caudoviricetes sp.]